MEIALGLERVPEFTLIEENFEQKLARVLEEKRRLYFELTGEVASLSPADPETLHARAMCAEIVHLEQLIDMYFKGNLIMYSFGPQLDNLVANKMVFRRGATFASCTLRFWAADILNRAIPVPPGTRVRPDDNVTFYTDQYAEIPPRAAYVDVRGVAVRPVEPGDEVAILINGNAYTADGIGAAGNGFPPGFVSLFTDRPAFVSRVENLETTGGGGDIQSDEDLKQDFIYEWTRHNTCGSREAYEYHVRAFRGDIGTVKAVGPNDGVGVPAGHVVILLLMEDGSEPPGGLLEEIRVFLMSDPIHTLGDFVEVRPPEGVPYEIELQYYIARRDANRAGEIQGMVQEAVQAYIREQRQIGRCINPDVLRELVMRAGAHRCPVISPVWTWVAADQVAALQGEPVVSYMGLEAC